MSTRYLSSDEEEEHESYGEEEEEELEEEFEDDTDDMALYRGNYLNPLWFIVEKKRRMNER